MKNKSTQTRIFWVVGTKIFLLICFVFCRYAVWTIHLNRDWPVFMFIAAIVTTGIAALFDARKIMVCTAAGYIGGFALGMLFNTYGVDPGGGAASNWWIIWTLSFFIIIALGIIWEVATRIIMQRKR